MIEISEVAKYVDEKAKEIAEQELGHFKTENPDAEVTEEMKTTTIQRSVSQLTFHITSFRFDKEGDIKEQFDEWFVSSQEEALRKTCYSCVADMVEKNRKDEDPNMSFLDRYLKEHKRKHWT